MIEVDLAMIENVVRLLLDGAEDVDELVGDRLNTLDLTVLQARVHVDRVEELNHLQQTTQAPAGSSTCGSS